MKYDTKKKNTNHKNKNKNCKNKTKKQFLFNPENPVNCILLFKKAQQGY